MMAAGHREEIYIMAQQLQQGPVLSLKDALTHQTPVDAGNVPWQHKVYRFVPSNEHLLSQAPAQVRALVQHAKTLPPDATFLGAPFAKGAVDAGLLKTKQDPHLIFAYYRKHLEAFGFCAAGYKPAARKA